MADEKEKQNTEEDIIVEMVGEDGDTFYCREEMIIPLNGEKYALLVPIELDEEGYEVANESDEDEAFFAKIVVDEDGEDNYVEPSEEEFEAVVKAYEALELNDEDEKTKN